MDALDQVAAPATDLLTRVESILTRAGAPAGHPVWPLLRRLRALPVDAVGAIAALRPGPLATAGPSIATLSSAYEEIGAVAGRPVPWSGAAADAFAARAGALVDEGADLARRLRATAAYAEAVTAWMADARRDVGHALAIVLTSTQAVTVRAAGDQPVPPPEAVGAAADVAARVLAAVARAYDAAETLRDEWAGRLAPRDAGRPAAAPAPGGGTTAVG